MSTAVAITETVCRTVLYLAAIWAFVKVAPLFLSRLQVAPPKAPPRTDQPGQPPADGSGVNGQAKAEVRQ